MTLEEFQARSAFSREELVALSRGAVGGFRLPGSLLLPFHEISLLEWNEAEGSGRMEAVRHNRIDDWFYACHFLGDPVMPGCWGVDAVWQALKLFAAWRGLRGCDRNLGMEDVSFFGQIRPHDGRIVYSLEITSVERSGSDVLVSASAGVSVDGCPVYSIGRAQVGTAFWEPEGAPQAAAASADAGPVSAPLSREQFQAKSSFSSAEILAISQGTLVEARSFEMGLLPSSLMLEIGEVRRIAYDEASGSGQILAVKPNSPLDWFYPMDGGAKPTALSIDGVWQLLGLFLAWRGREGTGRALGFERVEVFDAVLPADREISYEIDILKEAASTVLADARVFADGRPILKVANAKVGCHRNIRYEGYPRRSEMAFGGRLKTRSSTQRIS